MGSFELYLSPTVNVFEVMLGSVSSVRIVVLRREILVFCRAILLHLTLPSINPTHQPRIATNINTMRSSIQVVGIVITMPVLASLIYGIPYLRYGNEGQ